MGWRNVGGQIHGVKQTLISKEGQHQQKGNPTTQVESHNPFQIQQTPSPPLSDTFWSHCPCHPTSHMCLLV